MEVLWLWMWIQWKGHLQWARILASFDGRRVPRILHVVAGSSAYIVQLWWETPPWLSSAFVKESYRALEVREDSVERLCVARYIGEELGKHAKS